MKLLLKVMLAFTMVAFTTAPVTAISSDKVHKSNIRQLSKKELRCAAENIHFEARNQGFEGQLAVAAVANNRTLDARFPPTLCRVIYQKGQFSWTDEGHAKLPDSVLKKYYQVAILATDTYNDPTNGALYFHNLSVKPKWARKMEMKRHIKDHKFFSDVG